MSADYEVEKNVPLPARGRRGKHQALADALSVMEVGDSFTYSDASAHGNMAMTVRDYAKRANIKVTIKKLESGRYRAWRIA